MKNEYSDMVIQLWDNKVELYNTFSLWQRFKLLFQIYPQIEFKIDKIFVRIKDGEGLHYINSVIKSQNLKTKEKKQ